MMAKLISFCFLAVASLLTISWAAPHSHAGAPNAWHWRNSSNTFSIETDYYNEAPITGRTVTYHLEISNGTVSPDGVERSALLVNGVTPGPVIRANWGDWIVVHVQNNLKDQGTGIHFHGIRQNQTNPMDGVASITECPIAPGDSFVYKWRATQYGTSWYHSHYSLQQWDGVYGGIIIDGPSSMESDVDAGMVFLTDWGHQTVSSLLSKAESSPEPVKLENGLINGLNTYNSSGSRFETNVQAGKRYRFRVINTAVNSMFRFTIDNHIMTVVANDLVPVKPYNTTSVNVGIGQRYDVIISANQAPGDYWMRSVPQARCSAILNNDIRGILRYNSLSTALPTSTNFTLPSNCDDESQNLVPYLSLDVGFPTQDETVYWTRNTTTDKLIRWSLNAKATMQVQWSDPTLLQVANGNTTWPAASDVLTLTAADEHDFFVLASVSTANYTVGDEANFVTTNPPRRDTIMLPASGYIALAFKTDNPGAWLLHCHIGWHLAEGMALQLVERLADMRSMLGNAAGLRDRCNKWSKFQTSIGLTSDGSGL